MWGVDSRDSKLGIFERLRLGSCANDGLGFRFTQSAVELELNEDGFLVTRHG